LGDIGVVSLWAVGVDPKDEWRRLQGKPSSDRLQRPRLDFAPSRQDDFAAALKAGLSEEQTASLAAALADLMVCKNLVDDTLKSSPPDVFSLK